MKIGACIGGSYENALIAKEYGFDYIEGNCGNIVAMTDEEIEKFRNIGIPFFSANCFIGHRVVGKDRDENAISVWLDTLFEKASRLGIKILVFGSSGARKMHEGDDLEETKADIVSFLRDFVAPRAEKTGIMVAIEPLRKEECNVINTVAQAISIAKKAGSPNIKALADVKHMISSDDPLNVIPEYKGWLIHAHTSNPFPAPELGKKRIYPSENDEFSQDLFFGPLMEAGVPQCSIEADVIDFRTDCEKSIKVLSKYRG